MPELDTPATFWGAKAAEYDALIRRVVTGYDVMNRRLVDCVPPEARRVLELGCGTGNVSLAILDRLPHARLSLVDASPEMVGVAAARVLDAHPEAADRVVTVTSTFEDLLLEPGEFDLVISSLSLHHVVELAPVYAKLRAGLADGGALRLADGYAAESPALHDLHLGLWRAYWQKPGNLDEDEIIDISEHVRRHDHYLTLAEHFDMLRAAGFVACDCVWRDGLFGVVTAEAGG